MKPPRDRPVLGIDLRDEVGVRTGNEGALPAGIRDDPARYGSEFDVLEASLLLVRRQGHGNPSDLTALCGGKHRKIAGAGVRGHHVGTIRSETDSNGRFCARDPLRDLQ